MIKKFNVKFSILVVIIIGSCFATALKAEEGKSGSSFSLGVLGGLVYNSARMSTSSDVSIDTSGDAVFAGGLTAEIGLPAKLGLELDMLYIKENFSRHDFAGITSTASSGALQFPLMLRAHFIPFLNPGFGFYYGRTVTSWSIAGNNVSSSSTNYGKNDLGFVIALGTAIPIGSTINVVADLRYTRSLNNSGSGTENSLRFSQIQLFAGLRFDI
ncbi:MAG: outer membrane beta-barrel protein [bacterium]